MEVLPVEQKTQDPVWIVSNEYKLTSDFDLLFLKFFKLAFYFVFDDCVHLLNFLSNIIFSDLGPMNGINWFCMSFTIKDSSCCTMSNTRLKLSTFSWFDLNKTFFTYGFYYTPLRFYPQTWTDQLEGYLDLRAYLR